MNTHRNAAVVLGLALVGSALAAAPIAEALTASGTVPSISSITVTGYPLPTTPTITVNGSGFPASPPTGVPASTMGGCGRGDTGLDYGKAKLWLLDGSRSDGLLGSFEEGANFSTTVGNCGGIVIQSWSTTHIVFTLGSRYAADNVSLTSGDTVCVMIHGVPGCTKLP